MGLLDGQIASAIFQGFRNRLLRGTLYHSTPTGALDEFGDPEATHVDSYQMQGFTEEYKDVYKGARRGDSAAAPEVEFMVNIFAKSLPSGVQPKKDDIVLMSGTYSQLREVETDPATALWTCRAVQVQDPFNG